MDENTTETAAEEIAARVAEVAAEIIEDKAEDLAAAEAVIDVLVGAAIETEEQRNRAAFESRIYSAIDELKGEISECRASISALSSMTSQTAQTAIAAEAMAETSLTLQTSNLPSADAGDLLAVEEIAEAIVNPAEAEPEAVQVAPPASVRRRVRLL